MRTRPVATSFPASSWIAVSQTWLRRPWDSGVALACRCRPRGAGSWCGFQAEDGLLIGEGADAGSDGGQRLDDAGVDATVDHAVGLVMHLADDELGFDGVAVARMKCRPRKPENERDSIWLIMSA